METATLTWEELTKVRAEEDRGKVPAEVVIEAEKPETKLEPLIVRVVATLEVTEVGEMEEIVGAGAGGGVGGGVVGGGVGEGGGVEPVLGSDIRLRETISSSYQV